MFGITNGGPAFPLAEPGNCVSASEGMSLRDYFAAKAMHSLLTTTDEYPDEHWRTGVAIEAYMMADAMLKAREQKP